VAASSSAKQRATDDVFLGASEASKLEEESGHVWVRSQTDGAVAEVSDIWVALRLVEGENGGALAEVNGGALAEVNGGALVEVNESVSMEEVNAFAWEREKHRS